MSGTSAGEAKLTSTTGPCTAVTLPGLRFFPLTMILPDSFGINRPRREELSHVGVDDLVAPAEILQEELLVHVGNLVAAFFQMEVPRRLFADARHAENFIDALAE